MNKDYVKDLNENRLKDLNKLVDFRNKNNYIWSQNEVRNLLFIYAICLSHYDVRTALYKFSEMNNKVNCASKNYYHTMLKEIAKYCKYYKKFKVAKYKFSDEKIIQVLNISNDEMMNVLNNIISEELATIIEQEIINEEIEKVRIDEEIEKSIKEYELEEELLNYKDPSFFDKDNNDDNPFI